MIGSGFWNAFRPIKSRCPPSGIAMGSDRSTRARLVAHCCQGAFFGFGFVFTILTLVVMFWIAWCYFGLSIIQYSDSQRRAVVNYSYTSSKPLASVTTDSPVRIRSTTIATEETSSNSISKLPTTETFLRGTNRGESQVKITKEKEASKNCSLAKGDFDTRDRTFSNNATAFTSEAPLPSGIPAPRGPPRSKEGSGVSTVEKAAILTGLDDSEEDGIYPRKVLAPGNENRPEDLQSTSRLDILPTKVYDTDIKNEPSRLEDSALKPSRVETRLQPSDYPDRSDIQGSRRSGTESVYRDPEFDREKSRPPLTSTDRGRYDDFDDERGSRSRYDKRERGRESDDRLSKGDTRVYPEDRYIPLSPSERDDRYRVRERYPDDASRRGDDDRYEDRRRDYDERSRNRDRETKYRDRDLEARSPISDERYRDDDRYRSRDDRYRDRDDSRPINRDDDKYSLRDGGRYVSRDDDRYVSRDDDRYVSRDDDRYVSRDDDRIRSRDDEKYRYRDDDRYRNRDDEKYRERGDDRYKSRDEDKYRSDSDDRRDLPVRSREQKDDYRPRVDDSNSRSSSSYIGEERKPTRSRSDYDLRVDASVSDYDVPTKDRSRSSVRDEIIPSRLSRPSYDEERYRERDRDSADSYRRPSRYDDDVRNISPTRTRDESSFTKATIIDSRPRDIVSSSRYIDSERDRIRDDRYYDQDDRIRNTRLQDSSSAKNENPRRYPDDPKIGDRREDVKLDRRSYASEDDDEYRRRGASRTDDVYEDRTRRPTDETRRYRDDESYSRRDRIDDDEYKRSRTRDDYDRDRIRSRDRYDEEYRKDDDRYSARDDRLPPLPVRVYGTYPDDDERSRRRDPEIRNTRKEVPRDREEILRPSTSSRNEQRSYSRDEYQDSKSSSRRQYDEDLPLSDSRDFRDDYMDDRRYLRGQRKPSSVNQPALGPSTSTVSSREPTDVVIREKRFQTSDKDQNSRLYGDDGQMESKSREQVRPLSAKEVIEAAIRNSDGSDQNFRKVDYPVFNPRGTNLTSPEIIRHSERRGTMITAKKRRSV